MKNPIAKLKQALSNEAASYLNLIERKLKEKDPDGFKNDADIQGSRKEMKRLLDEIKTTENQE